MSAIRVCAAVATLAFVLNTAFAHADHDHKHDDDYGVRDYFVGEKYRKCTADGDRCAGAPHKPYVEYAPCCDSHKVCLEDAHIGWGRFCIDRTPKKKYADDGKEEKCYKTGMRCMGEKGKPYVDWMPCCDAKDKCVKAKDDWGSFCTRVYSKHDDHDHYDHDDHDHDYEKSYEKPEPKKSYEEYKDEYEKKYEDYKDEYEKKYEEYKDEYEKKYEEKYDDYVKKYGYGDSYGGEYPTKHMPKKGSDFAKKMDLFPPIPVQRGGAGGGQFSRAVNAGLIALLGLADDFGCAIGAAADPPMVDAPPSDPLEDTEVEFVAEVPIQVCNVPGRGLTNTAIEALLNGMCSRLNNEFAPETVECWIESWFDPFARQAVVENDISAVERQNGPGGVPTVGFRNARARKRFRCGREIGNAASQSAANILSAVAGSVVSEPEFPAETEAPN